MECSLGKSASDGAINLSIIVPCFNEEAVLIETNGRLTKLIRQMKTEGLISDESSVFYVDDGSRDRTWSIITQLCGEYREVSGIKLSRNRGHQNALFCGLMTAPGDALISVDADLQDDLNVIPQMVKKHLQGCEIVYGVRRERASDTFFKRATAEGYYRLLAAMGVDVVFNHADYRLLGRRAVDALSEFPEVNLFLRAQVRLLGFKSEMVEYDRAQRFAGDSKYPLRKMLSFAWQGITSFSTTPLRLITGTGVFISVLSISLGIWSLGVTFFTDEALPGWASTVIPIYFLGGVQLLSLGVIGEYIAKIYNEAKRRPRYIVESTVGEAFGRCPLKE